MQPLRVERLVGLDALAAATELLQRARRAHPTAGLYEAADLQWWWRSARSTDDVAQLVWFDHLGRPEAAVILTDWGSRVAVDTLVMPNAPRDLVAQVFERGLAHATALGYAVIGLEVGRDDAGMRQLLAGRGFAIEDDGVIEAWLDVDDRPAISALPAGYRLTNRDEMMLQPHHMADRIGPDVEERLRQTSLYRADLDLLIVDEHGSVAAYGLFWFDPVTATGLVEPMRTSDDHQRRGLARHVLTTGVSRLAEAGAVRVKVCNEPDNPAAHGLYRSVGFEPVRQTDLFMRRAVA